MLTYGRIECVCCGRGRTCRRRAPRRPGGDGSSSDGRLRDSGVPRLQPFADASGSQLEQGAHRIRVRLLAVHCHAQRCGKSPGIGIFKTTGLYAWLSKGSPILGETILLVCKPCFSVYRVLARLPLTQSQIGEANAANIGSAIENNQVHCVCSWWN